MLGSGTTLAGPGTIDPVELTPDDDAALADWLGDPAAEKVGHDVKLAANVLAGRGWALRGVVGDTALAAAKTFPGNRPSATILLDRLDPRTLGSLLAFYEHRTFTAACLLGINPFDQWGVELGKEMANAIGQGGHFDPSTEALMARAGLDRNVS